MTAWNYRKTTRLRVLISYSSIFVLRHYDPIHLVATMNLNHYAYRLATPVAQRRHILDTTEILLIGLLVAFNHRTDRDYVAKMHPWQNVLADWYIFCRILTLDCVMQYSILSFSLILVNQKEWRFEVCHVYYGHYNFHDTLLSVKSKTTCNDDKCDHCYSDR